LDLDGGMMRNGSNPTLTVSDKKDGIGCGRINIVGIAGEDMTGTAVDEVGEDPSGTANVKRTEL